MRQPADLRPYQDRIATHLYEHDAAMCVLRPGGGKTISALTAITDLIRDKVIRHALVLAPKRVARVVWPDEIGKWEHTRKLRYEVLDGPPRERKQQLMDVTSRDMTIAGIDIVTWLLSMLEVYPDDHPVFDLLVIDEVSKLRDPTGVRAKALVKAAKRWRMIWGLSGTLRPNSALDLFTPVRIVTKGTLWGKSYYSWRRYHFYPADFNQYDWQPFPGAEDKLNSEMAPLTLMIPEDEIPKVKPLMIFDKVDLPFDARHEYDRMQKHLIASVYDDEVIADSAAIATGKLAQIANGFLYLDPPDGDPRDAPPPQTWRSMHDEKRCWLEDIISEATAPTLLVYEYHADLDMLKELLPDLPYLGAGVSDRKAADHIKAWNAGELPFMGLHPASGGHGLNLQFGGADMAWISPCWSSELWEQTIARLARPGQTRPVVVRVCVANDTVDELKLARVHDKMSAQQAFEKYLQKWHQREREAA